MARIWPTAKGTVCALVADHGGALVVGADVLVANDATHSACFHLVRGFEMSAEPSSAVGQALEATLLSQRISASLVNLVALQNLDNQARRT